MKEIEEEVEECHWILDNPTVFAGGGGAGHARKSNK